MEENRQSEEFDADHAHLDSLEVEEAVEEGDGRVGEVGDELGG